jgi:hypothetical protein
VNRTTMVVGAAIILCGVSLFWLQGRFDKSDHEKGMRLVQNLERGASPGTPSAGAPAGAGPGAKDTFGEFLRRRHNGREGTWSSEITGGCRGVVRVTWTVPGTPPLAYSWDVEIPSQTVHPTPGSPAGEKLLQDFIAGREDKPLELPPLAPP